MGAEIDPKRIAPVRAVCLFIAAGANDDERERLRKLLMWWETERASDGRSTDHTKTDVEFALVCVKTTTNSNIGCGMEKASAH